MTDGACAHRRVAEWANHNLRIAVARITPCVNAAVVGAQVADKQITSCVAHLASHHDVQMPVSCHLPEGLLVKANIVRDTVAGVACDVRLKQGRCGGKKP